MNLGSVVIVLAFVSSLAAAVTFFRNKPGSAAKVPLRLFYVTAGGIVVSACYMLYLLTSHPMNSRICRVAVCSAATDALGRVAARNSSHFSNA